MLGLNYWEQLIMGTGNFLQLVSLASDWNCSTVLPFQCDSRLYGLPNLKLDHFLQSTTPVIDLGAIYDVDHMNYLLLKHGIKPLTFFKDFLLRAEREVTVFHLIHTTESNEIPVMKGQVKKALIKILMKEDVTDCSHLLRNFSSMVLGALNDNKMEGAKPFLIHKYLCVNASNLTTPNRLFTSAQLNNDHSGLTVVFVNWRGLAHDETVVGTKGVHANNRFLVRGVSHSLVSKYDIPFSSYVENLTALALQHFHLSQFVAVHLRTEKMGFREKVHRGSFNKCVKEVMKIHRDVLEAHPHLSSVYLVDYGPQGSDSCLSCFGAHMISKVLNKLGIVPLQLNFSEFGPGVRQDKGLVAMVELNILASASFLIECGGGAFQQKAASLFLKQQDRDRLFKVCDKSSFL